MPSRRSTRSADKPAPPLRLEYRSPEELAENPRNWRRHPESQMAALGEAMSEVGWAGACLYNERTGRLVDGHARRKLALGRGEKSVPVLIGNWTEEEEAKILATLDPLTAMAETGQEALDALLKTIEFEGEALRHLIGGEVVDEPDQLQPVQVPKAPPAMTWVLIGIPTVRFGTISPAIESIAAEPDTIVETTSNAQYVAAG